MKLLIITQKVDRKDPVLGFFHNWVIKLAPNFDQINTICLESGEHALPHNVKVFSLGKVTSSASPRGDGNLSIFNFQFSIFKRLKYIWNFYKYIWNLRHDYDAVFVHMNQEYVILGWKLWKLWGKKIFLWRNHPRGNWLTRLAVLVSDKVFCTSPQSFTARYRKTQLMPVGVDLEKFKDEKKERVKNSILFLGRMDRIKRPDLLVGALGVLAEGQTDFTCDFYGDPTNSRDLYYSEVQDLVSDLGLQDKVRFHSAIPNGQTPAIYAKHEIFVNLTPTGSMDKTIIEAVACGCLPILANLSLRGELEDMFFIKKEDEENVAMTLQSLMDLGGLEKEEQRKKLAEYARRQGLDILISKLTTAIKNV